MKRKVFETSVSGSDHSLMLPEEIVLPFLEKNKKRVKIKAFFEGRELIFYGAILNIKRNYLMTFGKRYQKESGVFPNHYFQWQLFEDDSKYGVEMPE
ncbi:hypothetical protein ACEZ3G_12475 [Maribacter algicola]|uniref:Uncharacterized protein n=1 Tax=Meishania litoralis TaxID=3434685 RepID=A0ACC7LLZ7_9FLAO